MAGQREIRGNKMFEVGRMCIKTAGRDANKFCLIIDTLDDKFVMIDGLTRRRKCNIAHLEPLEKVIKIKKNASHDDVIKEFEKLKLVPKEKKKIMDKKEKTEKKEKKAEEKKEEEKTKRRNIFKRKEKKVAKKK